MESQFLAIVLVAVGIGAICRVRGINPALPLIAAGLAFDLLFPQASESIPDPEYVLSLILAPLIFAAGLASSALDLRRIRRSVLLLAVVLVLVTTLVVGVVASAVIAPLPLAAACTLGAVLAPTDAVAAKAVADKSGLPRRVSLLVEGESLANDGTALTILRVATVVAVAGSVTIVEASSILLLAVVGGVAVGAGGGFLVSWIMRRNRSPVVSNAALLITPFVLYEASELIGGSGLLTVVIAGVWIAHATGTGPAYQARLQANSVWSLVSFLLESMAFVLVGVEFIGTASGVSDPSPVVIGLLALLLTVCLIAVRLAFMGVWFAVGPKLSPKAFLDRKRTAKEFVAVGLLGVRGPVSVLAAFSLPLVLADGEPFPARDLILTLTFVVVVMSLCFSFLVGPIIRRLNLNIETEKEGLRKARIALARAALRRLDEVSDEDGEQSRGYSEKLMVRMRSVAVRRVDSLQAEPEQAAAAVDSIAQQRALQRAMLSAERDELAQLQGEHRVHGDIVRKLTHELDVREAALGQQGKT